MKTTVDIPDSLYRQIKARTALRGQTVKAYLLEALTDKLTGQNTSGKSERGWHSVFGKAKGNEVDEVQRIIDEEFSRIPPDDWE